MKYSISTEVILSPKLYMDNGLEYLREKTSGFHFNYSFNIDPIDDSLPIKSIKIESQFRKFMKDYPLHHYLVIQSKILPKEGVINLTAKIIYNIMHSHFGNCKSLLFDLTYEHPEKGYSLHGISFDTGSLTYEMAEKLFDNIELCGRTPC